MMKVISKILIMTIIMLYVFTINVSAYEDDLFKFDLPSSYANMSYQDIYVFSDTEDTDRGIMIYTYNDVGLKKSVWDIEDSDFNSIMRRFGSSNEILEKDKRAKLGEEKAIKAILANEEGAIEMYMLASNKYIYIVMFIGNTQADLQNEDYQMIKDSFKLKDRTTNPMAVYILIFAAVAGIKFYSNARKARKNNQVPFSNKNIDYKNLTEEDLNNFRNN